MVHAHATAVRLVCFDLGGVLVRTCATWAEACHAAGVGLRDEAPKFAEKRGAWTVLFDLGRISIDEWADGVSQATRGAYSASEVKLIHDAMIREEHAGAAEIIDALHEAGVATACLSNTNSSHWARLIHHDGTGRLAGQPEYPGVERLERHVASHLLGLAKPDAAIYAEFERLVALRGRDILFFDDRSENIDAATHRGWRTSWIDPAKDAVAQIRQGLHESRVLDHAPEDEGGERP